MAPRKEQHRKRAIVLAAVATSWALAACGSGPKYVAWPETPPPSRPAPQAGDGQLLLWRALDERVVVHAPFRDCRCGACHVKARGGGALLTTDDRLCTGCHADDVRRARPHAGARQCLGCHARHVSMARGRVAGGGDRLCTRCHDPTVARFARAHDGVKRDEAGCTRCHDPHGSGRGGLMWRRAAQPVGAARSP